MTDVPTFGDDMDVQFAMQPQTNPALAKNPLEGLQAVLAQKVQKPPKTVKVRTRTSLSVRYNVNIDIDRLQAWQRRATNKRSGDTNALQMAVTMLSNQGDAILFNGQEAPDADGDPINFKSPELLTMLGVLTPEAAIKAFFGDDAELMRHTNRIVSGSGYGDADDEDDEDDAPLE